MAQLTDLSDLINRQTGGNNGTPEAFWYFKNGRVNNAVQGSTAGLMYSSWDIDGTPGRGAKPTTCTACDNSTPGAIRLTAPGSGRQKWLVSFARNSYRQGMGILYDRLVHITGLSGTSTSAQTVQGTGPTPATPRNATTGRGNVIVIEILTQIGTTATTVTASYIDQDGNTATTPAVSIGGTNRREAGRAFVMPLAAGDTGVKSVISITLAATTGTAGNIAVALIRPLFTIGASTCGGGALDFATGLPNLPELLGTECLALLDQTGTNGQRITQGYLSTVEK